MPPQLLVITGPTATGKTRLGVEAALSLGGEVVSADSMQLYRGMDIGTASPTREEMRGIAHHMLDIAEPDEAYSVSRYVEEAGQVVDDILARGALPIVVGGTGLYIDSLLSGRSFMPGSPELREKYSAMFDEVGGEEMLRLLAEFDPEAAQRLHANDKKRIVRAFEVYYATGKTITRHNEETKLLPPRYSSACVALSFERREKLYERIDRRVDMMFASGLEDEVRALLERGVSDKATAMQAIGYKETAAALRGECSMAEAIDTIKRESRRYAKRQLSWLSSKKDIHWILWEDEPDYPRALQIIKDLMQK
jgi:tRNA dimethylallyltransferase